MNNLKLNLNLIDNFYEKFGWIAESHNFDFYLEGSWERLPKCWRDFLVQLTSPELGRWLLMTHDPGPSDSAKIWPLGLLAFRQNIKLITLDRRQVNLEEFFATLDVPVPISFPQGDDKSPAPAPAAVVKNIFKRRVKPKKQHEISILSKIISQLAKSKDTKSVVDIGSGVGHLSRYLAFVHGLDVTSFDCDENFSATASTLDQNLLKEASRSRIEFKGQKKPAQVQKRLQVPNSSETNQVSDLDPTTTKFGLVGLHTCGDLATTVLKTFVHSQNSTFVVSLGCCYLKLSDQGYPMSKFAAGKQNIARFGHDSLEVATHAIEKFADSLINCDIQDLRIHAYRATLEYLIVKKYPHEKMKKLGLRGVKNFLGRGFKLYAREALADFDQGKGQGQIHFDDSELEGPEIDQMLGDWWKLIIFQGIRALMATIVESAILIDRVLYLEENGYSATISPVLDERISPRNFAIVGIKNK